MNSNKYDDRCEQNCQYMQIDNLKSAHDKVKFDELDYPTKIHRLDKEIANNTSILRHYHKQQENVERDLCNVNQLKEKGTSVLKNIESRNAELLADLKEIHNNIETCLARKNTRKMLDEKVSENIEKSTTQRDRLKAELTELKKIADRNRTKLREINAMIITQEKKNLILLRKLKRRMGKTDISAYLKEKIIAVLRDPRIIGTFNEKEG